MVAATLENLIFLTYLTNYNISSIYYSLDNANSDGFDELAYTAFRKGNTNFSISDRDLHASVIKALAYTHEAIDRLHYLGFRAITCFDAEYPMNLQQLSDKPPVLYIKGSLPKKKELAAVVGSREVSYGAERFTNSIVDVLAQCSYGIVSGLALGIDTFAHRRAVEFKQYTMAILPNSLEKIYPVENYKLASQILEQNGALISELIFGINRGKSSFVQRNRIQSGISNAVIPVEMGAKSGTMHTIDFAIRQKRDVFLFKRQSYSQYYEGIKYLIDKYSEHPHENVHLVTINDFIDHISKSSGRGTIGIQAKLF